MDFCSLYSGSSGNSIYVGNERTKILVDAGLSGKKIQEGLLDIGVNPNEINAILITHEHDDHIKAAGILSRRFNIPIYANADTWSAMESQIGDVKEENIKVFSTYKPFEIGDITVIPFKIPHDASNPCGYSFIEKNKKISIATDIGHASREVKDNIKDSDLILLESNHDVEMLKVGPYPYYLKRRVLSDVGHLSNEDCGRTIVDILNSRIKRIILGHLSKTNNYPELAYRTVLSILESNGIRDGVDIDLDIAHRDRVGKYYSV
ncbi:MULTISPECIES: MBL fold metallo-hydrolase [Caloramator]|uniref:Phosphoribosyl 1,2-cyclic phosphodiesterase n=1 Tax=Caloramator proteoclasticus DSM 10124 TaxID=1121262 RepID=A0A1M4U467_9CLOT|nr:MULTISPECIES: MBL fold metallo-hydrolase [Caloramator]SHE51426.1 Phosphoribosyl 1,2-cyclic phosphodiesterase [Caloramator proteoclasticus DSM 10124]